MTLTKLGLGALIGYVAAGSKITPTADDIKQLVESKPEYYTTVDIALDSARTNEEFKYSGNFMWVDNQFARGKVTIRLNEKDHKELDLLRQKYISGPFYQFFITNTVGQGTIRLIISRGFEFASEPLESINRAELAARLGSIVTYDRRGDVLWLEDFESGISRVETSTSGTGAAVEWSAERALRGGFSCKLTAGSDSDRYVQIKGYLPFPALSRLGYEAATSLDANMESTEAYIDIYTGTLKLQWGFRFTTASTNVDLITLGGTWANIYTGELPYYSDYLFNLSKLVIDTNTAKYDRMVTGPITMDLSAVPCNYSIDTTAMHLELSYKMVGVAGTNSVCYLDSIIMTQNEP